MGDSKFGECLLSRAIAVAVSKDVVHYGLCFGNVLLDVGKLCK